MEFLTNKSWKTSMAGISVILIAVGSAIKALTDNDPATTLDYAALSAAFLAGFGLMFARDDNKSSKTIGIK